MTDEQFKAIRALLLVIVVSLGFIAGLLLAFAGNTSKRIPKIHTGFNA